MKVRILLGATLIGLLALLFGLDHLYGKGHIFFGLLLALLAVAAWEVTSLADLPRPLRWLAVGLTLSIPVATWLELHRWSDLSSENLLAFVFWGAYLAQFFRSPSRRAFGDFTVLLFCVLYLGWMGSFFLKLRVLPKGELWLLYTLLVAKGTDIFAYFSGTLFGRHKWIPSISPGKTWEGLVGGMVGAGLIGSAMAWVLSENPNFHWYFWLLSSIILGGISQLGDLAESYLKRSFEVKDSAKWLPEFGGVLDLVDCLLFAGPVVYFLVQWRWLL